MAGSRSGRAPPPAGVADRAKGDASAGRPRRDDACDAMSFALFPTKRGQAETRPREGAETRTREGEDA